MGCTERERDLLDAKRWLVGQVFGSFLDHFRDEIGEGEPSPRSLIEIHGGLEEPLNHFIFGEGFVLFAWRPEASASEQ